MERDPQRVDQMIAILRDIWHEFPEMRLGQLLVNAIRPSEPCPEVFSIEDTKLARKLESLAVQLRLARKQQNE